MDLTGPFILIGMVMFFVVFGVMTLFALLVISVMIFVERKVIIQNCRYMFISWYRKIYKALHAFKTLFLFCFQIAI